MIWVSRNFPGGNIELVGIEGNTVRVRQDVNGCGERWFYWNFALTVSAPGEYRVCFDDSVVSRFGPATEDNGVWRYDRDAFVSHTEFTARFLTAGTRRFAFSIPYQLTDHARFLATLPRDRIRLYDWGLSERGRKIPVFAFGTPSARKVVFTCRHHACESVAAYSLEGAVAALLRDEEYCAQHETIVVPFVDVDGVETGEQGKSRLPHDHNRDYIDAPLYATTRRLKALADEGTTDVLIDFHCPARWGGVHDHMSLIGLPSPQAERQQRFSEILAETDGEIPYRVADNVPFGTHWNVGAGMATSCSAYFAAHGAALAFSFEHPYFGAGERPYDAAALRNFGERISRALRRYLQA